MRTLLDRSLVWALLVAAFAEPLAAGTAATSDEQIGDHPVEGFGFFFNRSDIMDHLAILTQLEASLNRKIKFI